jgi:hypothetical protein
LVYPSISLQPNDKDPEYDLIKKIANVVPILNGRDSAEKPIHLGPQLAKIPRRLPNPVKCID